MTLAAGGSPITDAGMGLLEAEIGRSLGLEPDDLRAGLDVAKNLIERGAPDRAMRIYAALVIVEPKVVDYQIGLANCAIEMGEYYLAIQAASAAIVLDPRNPRPYFLSGRACMAVGELPEAVEDLSDAKRLAEAAGEAEIAAEADRLIVSLTARSS